MFDDKFHSLMYSNRQLEKVFFTFMKKLTSYSEVEIQNIEAYKFINESILEVRNLWKLILKDQYLFNLIINISSDVWLSWTEEINKISCKKITW